MADETVDDDDDMLDMEVDDAAAEPDRAIDDAEDDIEEDFAIFTLERRSRDPGLSSSKVSCLSSRPTTK